MNQLSVTDLQRRGFTANPVGLPHFWRTIPSAAGPQQLYIQPWCSWYFPGAPPTACHRNAEPQSLWDLGGRVPQPSHTPHTHHQVCHSRATLPAQQGKSKSRPHNLQKHLAPTSPSEVCPGHQPSGAAQMLSRGPGSGQCPPAKPAAAGLAGVPAETVLLLHPTQTLGTNTCWPARADLILPWE